MLSMVFLSLYYFFMLMEGVLFLYIISVWFPGTGFRKLLYSFLQPVLSLLQLLLKHSVFKSSPGDISPMIALLLFSYLQTLFYQLSNC